MALPKIHAPVYEYTLPDSQQTIRFRPLLAGEYKTLISVVAFQDTVGIAHTITNILQSCIQDELDVRDWSFVDVEAFFLHLFARSNGGTVSVNLVCTNPQHDEDGKHTHDCGEKFSVTIHLDELVMTPEEVSRTIDLGSGVGIRLKYPKWDAWFRNQDKVQDDDELVIDCIESIWDDERVYIPGEDASKEELLDFLNHLDREASEHITRFIQSMPTVHWKKEITCPKCGVVSTMELNGLSDFLN